MSAFEFNLVLAKRMLMLPIHRTANDKYRAGYTDCAREVAKYLSMPEPPPSTGVPSLGDSGCKARLLRHLDQCIVEIDTEIGPATTISAAAGPAPPMSTVTVPHSSTGAGSVVVVGGNVVGNSEILARPSSAFVGVRKQFDDNSMDYSSQDSNPLDFSRNNKEMLHQHLIAQGMMLADESLRHGGPIVVRIDRRVIGNSVLISFLLDPLIFLLGV